MQQQQQQHHHHHQHQQHQMDDGGGGGHGAKASVAAAGGPIVVQLPSTSANPTSQARSEAVAASPAPERACLVNGGGPGQGASRNESVHSRCHHQAATRDLMLQQHQETRKHKYWRRDFAPAPGTVRAVAGHQQQQQRPVNQADGTASRLAAAADAASSAATTTSSSSSTSSTNSHTDNSSDNISDNSIPPPPNYHEIPGIVPSYHGRTSGPPPAYEDVVNPNAPPPSYQSLFGQVREARKTSNGLVDLLRQLFLVLIGTIGCTMIIGFLLLIPITMILVGFFYLNECRAENIPSFLVVGGFVWIIKNMLNCYNQFKKDSSSVNRPPPRRAPRLSTASSAAVEAGTSSSSSASGDTSASNSGPLMAPGAGPNQHLQDSVLSAIPAPDGAPATQRDVEQPPVVQTTASPAGGGRLSSTRTIGQTGPSSSSSNNNQHRHGRTRQPQLIGLTSDKIESILNYFLIVWFLTGCIVVYRIYEPDYDNPLSVSYCNRTVYLYAFWLMTSAFIIMAIVLSCLCCLMASSLISCSQGR
jgi:hypothetical protein